MKKWENPELLVLGVENTKEDNGGQEPRIVCRKCKSGIGIGNLILVDQLSQEKDHILYHIQL